MDRDITWRVQDPDIRLVVIIASCVLGAIVVNAEAQTGVVVVEDRVEAREELLTDEESGVAVGLAQVP